MRGAAVVVVAAVVAAVVGSGEAKGACKTYQTTLNDGSNAFCAGIVDYQYYAADELVPQEELELRALLSIRKDSVVEKILLLLPPKCLASLKRAACLANFPRCEYVDPFYLGIPGLTAPNEVGAQTCEAVKGQWLPPPPPTTPTTNYCFIAVPKFPCRGPTCHDPVASSKLTADCPAISGMFATLLLQKQIDGVYPELATEFTDLLGTPCNTSECFTRPVTVNILTAFGFAPDCGRKETTSLGELEIFPAENQQVLQVVLESKIAGATDCGIGPFGNATTCDDLRKVYKCGELPAGRVTVQRTYDVVPSDSVCSPILRSEENLDKDALLRHNLAALDSLAQALPQRGQCFQSHKLGLYRGLYYVPSFPGQTPLAQRVDPDAQQLTTDNWDEEACPARWEGTILYGNTPEAEPLCVTPAGNGYNARDCLSLSFASSTAPVPPFIPTQCRVAFLEMACSKAFMKLQTNWLCLLPNGCERENATKAREENRVAFEFALPRFSSKKICKRVVEECSMISGLNATDCDEVINIQSCGTEKLTDGSIWNCSNPLNGLPYFPESEQVFASASQIPIIQQYASATGLPVALLDAAFVTQVVNPTISKPLYTNEEDNKEDYKALLDEYCACPEPLVVPDNPFGATLPNVCCALPCRGSMHTEENMVTFGGTQIVLAGIGSVCALFMVATWGFFKEKHKQYMTFWLSLCSFNVSLGFFVLAASAGWGSTEPALCVDNSEPHTLQNGFSVCVFQATWLVFFASAECSWWAVQSVDLFRKLVLGKRNTEETKFAYHMFAWAFPTVTTSALLGTRSLGYRQPTPYCLIHGDTEPFVEWVSFYLYVAILFLAGTIMMFSVLAVIIRHTNRSAHLQGTSSSGKLRQRYRMYRTPMLFVLLFIFVWLNIFSFRLLVAVNQSDYEIQGAAWVRCLLTNYFKGIPDPATNAAADASGLIDPPSDTVGCGLTQGGIPRASLMITFVVVMGQPILIFIVFGSQSDAYTLWLEYFGCRDPSQRSKHDVTDNTFSKDDTRNGANTSHYQVGGSSYYGSKQDSTYAGGGGGSYFSSIRAPRGPAPAPPPSPGSFSGY